jgi:NCS1 family nucleobase:cation symporter-1
VSNITHADPRVQLDAAAQAAIEASPLYNHDLAPVRIAQRTWNTWDFAALWVSMAHCIPTYTLAAGFVSEEVGMNWWQALLTILIGNLIVLAPILLNSHPGTKYGIPFPVFARAAYGVRGSNLPALMRALVACGWFGINAWIGGLAVQTFMHAIWPGWDGALGVIGGHAGTEWLSFAAFWALNMFVIFRGMDVLRRVERWAAPFVLIMTAALVWWAIDAADGLGPIMNAPGQLHSFGAFFPKFMPALTGVIAFWSTLSLNMPDFTRFGRSQREQVIGQAVALPSTMTVFAGMGILITSASAVVFGKAESQPMELARHFHSPVIVAIAMFTVIVATLAVNIAANTVSPANDFANAFPKHIGFKAGGLITGVIGVLMMPWELYANPGKYINDWLGGYGGILGSIAGVLIVDYWILRKRQLVLRDLYVEDGAYTYRGGWHVAAAVSTLAGCAVAISGRFIGALAPLYPYSWFLGFGVAGGLYALTATRPRAA